MKRILLGICIGIFSALVRLSFLLFAPNLEWTVHVSEGFTWVAIGILISVCDMRLHGVWKGIIVAILVSGASLIYTAASSWTGAVWTLICTVVLGACAGFLIDGCLVRLKDAEKR